MDHLAQVLVQRSKVILINARKDDFPAQELPAQALAGEPQPFPPFPGAFSRIKHFLAPGSESGHAPTAVL
jgi:hypothetical protein